MASSSTGALPDEIDQLLQLQRSGILSVADFARMAAEITKTNEQRLSEVEDSDKSTNEQRPSEVEDSDKSESDLADESGNMFHAAHAADDSALDGMVATHSPEQSLERAPEQLPEQSPEEPSTPLLEGSSEDSPAKWPSHIKVNCSAVDSSLIKDVRFLRVGGAADFINSGRAYIEFYTLKKGCVRKYEKHNRWVSVDTLKRSSPPTEEAVTSPTASPRKSPRRSSCSDASARAQRPGVETGTGNLPTLAAHERGRKLVAKQEHTARGTTWGLSGERKTEPTKVPLQKRVDAFPDQSLIVASTPNGKVILCRCCPKEIENILGTVKVHLNSDRHKENLVKWMEKNKTDAAVKEFLEQYFQENPDEEHASVSADVQLYRWRVVEACLFAGIALNKIDDLRELLERGGTALTASTHLKAMVPNIEEFELVRLRKELVGQRVCVIYDGTTRLGECIAVLLRWCPVGFTKIEQRLVALRTTEKHMDGDELGALINTILGTTCQVQTINVVCGARDSCSTNGKAMRNLAPMYINMEAILCISHTLSHCGEHVDLPVLNDFMTPWLGLVQHHPSARSIWKQQLGGAMKGYSTIRWCSREECSNEIAKNFGALPDFVDRLLEDEIGEKLPKK